MQRGILGVKKDPKRQMLFSFNVRAGEEMPTDSEDSDYEPTGVEAAEFGLSVPKKSKKKKDRNKNSESNKRLKKNSIVGTSDASNLKHSSWSNLPSILLLKIFRYVIESDGALPFLCRAARVSQAWADMAAEPSLWKTVDLSYGWIKSNLTTLTWLCHNRLSKTADLNLTSWKCLENNSIKVIIANCPELRSISLSYCSKLNSDALKELLSVYEFESVDFSFMSSNAMSPAVLKYLTEERSSRLKHLTLSGNQLRGSSGILTSLSTHCPCLETLDISNCTFSTDYLTFNIERIQIGCPNLKFLRLANNRIRAPYAAPRIQAESPGFPKLQELSVAASPDGRNCFAGLDNDCLYRILKTSYDLKLLDLRSCGSINAEGIHGLPITDLRHLYLFQCSVAKYSGIEVILAKWKHSLVDLDISWNLFPNDSLKDALDRLSDDSSVAKIEQLNLSGTSVSVQSIGSLLRGCPDLWSINLTSCRSLPRGIKREYQGKLELRELEHSINSMGDESDEEVIVHRSKPRRATRIKIQYSDSD